jgi:hypothetical protein
MIIQQVPPEQITSYKRLDNSAGDCARERGFGFRRNHRMRKLPYLLAAAAISGLALSAVPGSASPLAGGLASGNAALPEVSDGLIQKVHGWHCRRKWSRRWGRHRHRRACYDDYYYPGYGLGVVPFFSFQFFDDDDGRRHRRRHFRRHRRHWD